MPSFSKGLLPLCLWWSSLVLLAAETDVLVCELILNNIFFQVDEFGRQPSSEFLSCHPVHNETGYVSPLMYTLQLPDSLYRECRMRLISHEDVYVAISDATLKGSVVSAPNPESIRLVAQSAASHRKRELETRSNRAVGLFKVIVLRVIASDSEPDFSADELYALTFEDEISLKGQMNKCSFGKLQIVPTKYGVLDVRINMTIQDKPYAEAVNAAYLAALELVSEDVEDIRDLVDAVMIAIPPGSEGSWAGFGALNGKQTTFNNKWAGYVGGAMHEIGYVLVLQRLFRRQKHF
jgi:hypothetical protein